MDKLKPVNINFTEDVYLCESNENKNTVNTLNPGSYLPEIVDMLDSFMDWKDKPPDHPTGDWCITWCTRTGLG